MILLAIDLYGIRPFEKPKRISFKAGFNTIVGQNGSGKTMVYQVLSSIFFNTPVDEIAFISNETRQAAVTFQTKDAVIYRIARDYQKEAWNLSKLEGHTKKFTGIESDQRKIFEWLQQTTGGLGENERSLLFMIDRFRLPSHMPHAAKSAILPLPAHMVPNRNGNGNGNGNGNAAPNREPSDPFGQEDRAKEAVGRSRSGVDGEKAKKEEALKNLEKELDMMTEVEDEMLRKRDEAAAVVKQIETLKETEQKIGKMEEVMAEKYVVFSQEGTVRPEQERAYEEGDRILDVAFEEMEVEAQSLEATLILKKQEVEKKKPMMMIGLVVGGISLLLPFVATLTGYFRYLFLAGVLGGTGLSTSTFFKRSGLMAGIKAAESRLSVLKKKGGQLENHFEKEHSEIINLIKKIGVKDLSELQSVQKVYLNLLQKKEAASKKMTELLADETVDSLTEKSETLYQEGSILQDKLSGHQKISEEVYRLQEMIRSYETKQESPDMSFADLPELESPDSAPASSFLSAILDIGGLSVDERRERLENHAGILFRRFHPEHSDAIQVKAQGDIMLGEIPINQLSAGLADQVYLSLALSAISQFSEVDFPVFLDDPFTALDHFSNEAAIKILQIISKKRQVILFTVDFELSEVGHRTELVAHS